jgi:Gene product 88
MRTPAGRQQFIAAMFRAIRDARCRYFRVHDSGDMFSAIYAECWLEICRRMPEVRFWIPTRAWQAPTGPLPVFDPLLAILRKLATLPNVTVRPSALNFGDHAPVVARLHAGSTAAMPDALRAYQCPAHLQGNRCGDCRVCWEDKSTPIAYQKH